MKKRILIAVTAVVLALFLAQVGFAAEKYTNEEKYSVDDCWIEAAGTGEVYACWKQSLYSSSYCIRVRYQNKTLTNLITVSGTRYEITDLVYKNGKGYYTVEVYASKGGPSLKVISDTFEVDADIYNAAGRLIKSRERQKIEDTRTFTTVDLRLNEQKVKAGKVRPITFSDGSYYTVQSVAYSKPFEQWVPGDHVTISVTIVPRKGYIFGDNMKVTCSKAESASISGTGDTRVVTLRYIPYSALAMPHLLYITPEGVLYWEKVENARKYIITVNENQVDVEKITQNGTKVDLSEYLQRSPSLVSVTIQANAGDNDYIYVNSSKLTIDNLADFAEEYTPDGTFEAAGNARIFQSMTGEPVYGWKKIGRDWYYFGEDGRAHKKGWFLDRDGSWYYFNDYNRAMCSEWLHDTDGSWYYLGPDCRMMKNTTTPDGYQVGPDGRWIH